MLDAACDFVFTRLRNDIFYVSGNQPLICEHLKSLYMRIRHMCAFILVSISHR